MAEATLTLVQFLRDGLDPVPELGRLRAEEPVSPLQIPGGPRGWLVTRYADVRAVLSDSARFSNDFANFTAGGVSAQLDPGGLGFRDPPQHTALRRLLTPEFTVRRLRRLEPRITEIVRERLDVLSTIGPGVDLVEHFAMPIPSLVVCELLGVRYAEREEFLRYSNDRFDASGDPLAMLSAVGESLDYLEDFVARHRTDPGDGLLGELLREHGDEVDDRELAGLVDGLLTGGHDTTTSSITLGTALLLRHRDDFERIRADDGAVEQVVEEILRHTTVVQVAFPRFAKEDLEIGGQRIAAGDLVLVSLSGANRDPELGPNMEAFDPSRATAAPHLAFGHGTHHCVGAQLARMELRIAFPALVRRFPTMRLADPLDEIAFRPISIVYGAETLRVTWPTGIHRYFDRIGLRPRLPRRKRRSGRSGPIFSSSEQLYEILGTFLAEAVQDPEIRPLFAAAGITLAVRYTDPDAVFFLDCRQDPPLLRAGEAAEAAAGQAEITLRMSADDGHRFWLDELNLPLALARRAIKVDGPINALLGLAPVVPPASARYREHVTRTGLAGST